MDKINLNGHDYRVEVNWNAIAAYLETSGREDVRDLAGLATIKVTDLAGLLAAAINEGERLEGRESSLTAKEVGAMAGVMEMAEFVQIFTRQTTPKGVGTAAEKKE